MEFAKLGLVVADEQHRFGVETTPRVKGKGREGRLSVDERNADPADAGRDALRRHGYLDDQDDAAGSQTDSDSVAEENSLRTIMPQLLDQLEQGGQIYIVCSAIEENENFDGRNGA